MSTVLIVFIIFALFPGVILGFILLSRYLKYRETLAMIEHGIMPPPPSAPPVMMPPMPVMPPQPPVAVNRGQGGAGRGTLVWGLVLSGVGFALTLALWPIGFIANSASGNTVNFPLGLGPWMLAGFTPLFVGLALILGYIITRPERASGPHSPAPPGRSGGGEGARVPFGPDEPRSDRVPFVPTEATVRHEGPGTPPGTPAP